MLSEGGMRSCVSVAVAGALVRPLPPCPVATTSSVFVWVWARGTAIEKCPAASAVPVTAVVPPFTEMLTSAPRPGGPVTVNDARFGNRGSGARDGGGGARHYRTRPASLA